ncbi:hypothetical protein GCM10023096_83860 [Nonomuraea ferruginea]
MVNRRPHSGQVRLRLIAAPSSVERLSMTLVSGWRQNGQCTLTPPRFRGHHRHGIRLWGRSRTHRSFCLVRSPKHKVW